MCILFCYAKNPPYFRDKSSNVLPDMSMGVVCVSVCECVFILLVSSILLLFICLS